MAASAGLWVMYMVFAKPTSHPGMASGIITPPLYGSTFGFPDTTPKGPYMPLIDGGGNVMGGGFGCCEALVISPRFREFWPFGLDFTRTK